MPRPKRVRIIQCHPKCSKFCSNNEKHGLTNLTMEEFETIRLMDYLCLTHDEAATMMNISRTTVTEIYESARKKVAEALCEGNDLEIKGGNYEIKSHDERISEVIIKKEGKVMKIAVTYENGNIFQHFGHTENFKIYEVENNKVLNSVVAPTNGQGHGALAGFLKEKGVDLLICGGIGGGAINALGSANIQVLPGANGDADKAVEAYLSGSLEYNPNTRCDHHDHEHGEDHECHCGNHHEGEHHCGCGDKK